MTTARQNKSMRTEVSFTDWVLGRSLAPTRTIDSTNRLRNVSYRLSAEASCVQIENNFSASSKSHLRKNKDDAKTKKIDNKDATTQDANISVGGAKKSINVVDSTIPSTQKENRSVKNSNGHDPSKLTQDVKDSSKSGELSREEKSSSESSSCGKPESKMEGIVQPPKPDFKETETAPSLHKPPEKALEKASRNNSHDDHEINKPGPHILRDKNTTTCTSVNADKATRITNHATIWSNEIDFEGSSSQKSNSSLSLKLEPDDIWSEQDCRILEFLESNYDCNKWLYIQAAFFNWTGRMISGELIARKFYSDGLQQ